MGVIRQIEGSPADCTELQRIAGALSSEMRTAQRPRIALGSPDGLGGARKLLYIPSCTDI